jgi:hypothetical protein
VTDIPAQYKHKEAVESAQTELDVIIKIDGTTVEPKERIYEKISIH